MMVPPFVAQVFAAEIGVVRLVSVPGLVEDFEVLRELRALIEVLHWRAVGRSPSAERPHPSSASE
jgi:hypothetical protein